MNVTSAAPNARQWSFGWNNSHHMSCNCERQPFDPPCGHWRNPTILEMRGFTPGETEPSVIILVFGCDLQENCRREYDNSEANLFYGVCLLPNDSTLEIGNTVIDQDEYDDGFNEFGIDIAGLPDAFVNMYGGQPVCYFSSLSQFIYDCGYAVGLTTDHEVVFNRNVSNRDSMTMNLVHFQIQAAKEKAEADVIYVLK
jgi:hypothetical protein